MRESTEKQVEGKGAGTGLPAGPPVEPIAIIGMGCRLPGDASTPERYWELLRDGVDAVTEVPRDRFDIDQYYHPEPGTPGKTHTRIRRLREGDRRLDPVFAGVAPKNAASIDPQQRMFAVVCWAALEDAGIPAAEPRREPDRGLCRDVERRVLAPSRVPPPRGAGRQRGRRQPPLHGLGRGLVPPRAPRPEPHPRHRVLLVARGGRPGVQSLRSGACDLALAGGSNAILGPENFICFSGMQVLSPDGRCKAFDASADGFGRGEGAGARGPEAALRRAPGRQPGGGRHLRIGDDAGRQDGRHRRSQRGGPGGCRAAGPPTGGHRARRRRPTSRPTAPARRSATRSRPGRSGQRLRQGAGQGQTRCSSAPPRRTSATSSRRRASPASSRSS